MGQAVAVGVGPDDRESEAVLVGRATGFDGIVVSRRMLHGYDHTSNTDGRHLLPSDCQFVASGLKGFLVVVVRFRKGYEFLCQFFGVTTAVAAMTTLRTLWMHLSESRRSLM